MITLNSLENVIEQYLNETARTGNEPNGVDAHDVAIHLAVYLNCHGVPVDFAASATEPARQLLAVVHRDGITRICCQARSCLWHWPLERGAYEFNGRFITNAIDHALRRHSAPA